MTKRVKLGKSGRIILMDLNVALSSNFRASTKGFADKEKGLSAFGGWIIGEGGEQYRQWMAELLSDEYVILMTARHKQYEQLTLDALAAKCQWQPQAQCFRRPEWKEQPPHVVKQTYLDEIVLPEWGETMKADGTPRYFAIDSNSSSRAMYKRNLIEARDAQRDDSKPWDSILPMATV